MAKKSFDEAQTISRYVSDIVRRRALRAIAEHDEQLSKVYDRIAAGIRKDLRAAGFTVKQVREVLEKHLGGTAEERARIVEEAIKSSAREARALDQETFDAIFGGDAEAANAPRPFEASTRAPVLSLSRRRGSEDEQP